MNGPGARVPAGIDGVERAARGLVEEEERRLEEAVGEEREELSVLGENELAGGGGGAALRAILRQDRLDGLLEVRPHVGEARGVQLQRGGAREGEHDRHAVEAFEEPRVGGGHLQALVEDAQTALAGVRRIAAVKEPKKEGEKEGKGVVTGG